MPSGGMAKNRAGRHAQGDADLAAERDSKFEVNTTPRKPEGWQGRFNEKVKEYGVYAAYKLLGC